MNIYLCIYIYIYICVCVCVRVCVQTKPRKFGVLWKSACDSLIVAYIIFKNAFYADEDKISYLPNFVMASLKVYLYFYLLLFPLLKRVSYITKANPEPSQQSKMELFMKIVTAGKYSCKELHPRYLAGFLTRICIHSFPLTINFDNYIL